MHTTRERSEPPAKPKQILLSEVLLSQNFRACGAPCPLSLSLRTWAFHMYMHMLYMYM